MKKTMILLSLAITSLMANATIRQIDNNPTTPGVYATIQAAHDAAYAGDTLYIHNSATTYAGAIITKRLVIYGEGVLPDKNFRFQTSIQTLSFEYVGAATASGSELYGCKIQNVYIGNMNQTAIANITIQRCSIGEIKFWGKSTSASTGLLISNNVIDQLHPGLYNQGFGVIKNSVVRNNIIGGVEQIGSELTGAWNFQNNIVLGSFTGNRNAAVFNNIFYAHDNFYYSSNEYCALSYNSFLLAGTTLTTGSIVYGTNTGGNNLLNVDPMFVTPGLLVPGPSFTTPPPFVNFNLLPGSPCIASGADGLDMGIYGGGTPFFEGIPNASVYRYFPMPNIPAVLDMNILNSTVLPNGTLNVEFISRKQN